MAKVKGIREQHESFRMTFGEGGKIIHFYVEKKGDCCASCAGADRTAIVQETSENARHLMGEHSARSSFFADDATRPTTSDGKPGYAAGVIVRDIC